MSESPPTPRELALKCLAAATALKMAGDALRDREDELRQAELAMADALPQITGPLGQRVVENHRLIKFGKTLHETLIELDDGPALVQFRCDDHCTAIRASVRRVPPL